MKRFLIVAAMPEESGGNFEKLGHPVCYTGLGKINGTLKLLRDLSHFAIRGTTFDAVINLGTVGSASEEEGNVVQVSKFIQRDMLCEPLAPRYRTPFDAIAWQINADTCGAWKKVVCGTGDSFVNPDHLKMYTGPDLDYQVVDMEGFAMARVCMAMEVKFYSLKYVSDLGDAGSWERRLGTASKALTNDASDLIEILKSRKPTKKRAD